VNTFIGTGMKVFLSAVYVTSCIAQNTLLTRLHSLPPSAGNETAPISTGNETAPCTTTISFHVLLDTRLPVVVFQVSSASLNVSCSSVTSLSVPSPVTTLTVTWDKICQWTYIGSRIRGGRAGLSPHTFTWSPYFAIPSIQLPLVAVHFSSPTVCMLPPPLIKSNLPKSLAICIPVGSDLLSAPSFSNSWNMCTWRYS